MRDGVEVRGGVVVRGWGRSEGLGRSEGCSRTVLRLLELDELSTCMGPA